MTELEQMEISRLKAHYTSRGKLREAKAMETLQVALRRLDRVKEVPPKAAFFMGKLRPPAKRHPMDVMFYGDGA